MSDPETYGHGAFNIFSGGALITTLGVIWFLHLRALLVDYLLAVLLLVVGMLVVIAGIRHGKNNRILTDGLSFSIFETRQRKFVFSS